MLLSQVSAQANTEILPAIDLGVLLVDETTEFSLKVPYTGPAQIVVEMEPDCSCLDLKKIPDSIGALAGTFAFQFTPNGTGPAEIKLEIKALEPEHGTERTYTVPVKVVGYAQSPSTSKALAALNKVSPSIAYQQLGAYRVIDVRGELSYAHAHIPGSFEYSLDALLAHENLRAGEVLLVGANTLSTREASLLKELYQQSPHIQWLEGGMPAWLREGLPAEGTWPSAVRASRISLGSWLAQGSSGAEWVVVDLSDRMADGERFFGHEVLRPRSSRIEAIQSSVLNAMEAAMRLPAGRAVLVIGDARELVYPIVEAVASESSPIQIYYLQHGALAYQNWKLGTQTDASPGAQTISLTSNAQLPAPGSPHLLQTSGKSGCRICPKKR